MHDLLALLAQIGVYPVLLLVWFKLDTAGKHYAALLEHLQKSCPHCRNIALWARDN